MGSGFAGGVLERMPPIPYRVHSPDELDLFRRLFQEHSRTIWDVERFWERTREEGKLIAKKIKSEGFIVSEEEVETKPYYDADYPAGSFSLIHSPNTPERLRGSNPSEYCIGKIIYWQDGGFEEAPITARYDMDVGSRQDFKEVTSLRKFLEREEMSFRVVPSLAEAEILGADARKTVEIVDRYMKARLSYYY